MLIKQLIWSRPPLKCSVGFKISTWKRSKQKPVPISTIPITDNLKCDGHKAQKNPQNHHQKTHCACWHLRLGTGERTTIKKNTAVPLSFWRMPFPWEESPILPGVVVQFAANPADLPLLEGHPATRTEQILFWKIHLLPKLPRFSKTWGETGYDELMQIPAVHTHQLWVKHSGKYCSRTHKYSSQM